MAVNPAIEDFAFDLFRKLWIRNGLPDYTKMVPDYPAVADFYCPDDLCDTVFAFQCLCSSFFEELCELDYNAFAHSRSDFFFYLPPIVEQLQRYGLQFDVATLTLAVIFAEMGMACARKDNYIFIFSCPLAFAMLFEGFFGYYFDSIGPQSAFEDLFSCPSKFSHLRDIANVVKRSKSLRRDLIYRLQLLRFELRNSSCSTNGIIPEELFNILQDVIKTGAVMDNSKLPTELFSLKFRGAVFFPICLQIVHQEQFVVYLKPLYEENFIKRQDYLRKCLFQEIADQCFIHDEEYKQTFITLYEESVFGELAEIPPKPKITPDSSSAHELHDLDPNCMVSREIHTDDRDPDNRDAARRPEEHSAINSDTPSIYELYDLKPKDSDSRDPYDDCDLDALDTRHPPCGSAETNKRNVSSGSTADASEFDDVQSNVLMENHSKIEEKIEEGYGGSSSRTLDIFYKLRTMSDSQVSVDAFENSKLPRASERKDQEVTIDTSASELKDQEVIIDTSASELKDQEVTINTSASELKDQEVTIDKSASELKDQEVTIDTSASELKDQEVTIETSASILEDQGISIGTTFELRDPDISDDINVSKVKDQEISIDTYTSNLRDPEGVLDTGPFELIGVCIGTGALKIEDQEISSDTNDFDTRNQIILEDTGASKLDDEMIFSPDGSVSQNNAEGKNFEFGVVEFNSSKNITSPSEVYLKSKRVVKADELGNLSVTLHFNTSEIKNQEIFVDDSASECKNDGIFSAIDDSVCHGDSGEAHADFEILNKNSSPRNSMDVEDRNEKTLLDDSQSSVFDIFSEQYLKLENNETASGDSNTLKFNDREVIDENCLEREDVFEEPVSSDSFPLQIKDVYSNKSPDEAFSKIESSPKTSLNPSEDSICTVASVETYRSKIAKNSENVSQPESKLPSELPREVLNPILEFGAKLQEMDKIIQQVYMLLEATHEELNTEHNDNKNDCCEYQIPSSPKPLSIGTINEDEEKSEKGSKKRKNRSKKKNEQDNDKETEGPTIVENGLEESEIIESDVYQLILIMGAPFEKPIKRDVNERFMERITIKSF